MKRINSLVHFIVFVLLTMSVSSLALAGASKNITLAELFKSGKPRDVQGKISSAAPFKNKATMVIFWEEGCYRSAHEVPTFNKIQERYQAKGLKVVGISVNSTPQQVKEFASKNKTKYPLLVGSKQLTTNAGVSMLPAMLLFNKNGVLAQRITGCQTEEALAEAIDKLLGSG